MAPRGTPRRRSTAEVRALVLAAAHEEFLDTEFAQANVRSIAERAGVSESMVFRHFPSKTDLFRAAAVAPLTQFVTDYAQTLVAVPVQDPRETTSRFVDGMFELCVANRRVLMSLIAIGTGEQNQQTDFPLFESCIGTLVDGVERYMTVTGTRATEDIRGAIRLTLALILGTALGGNELFARDGSVGDTKRLLVQFVLHGAGHIPE